MGHSERIDCGGRPGAGIDGSGQTVSTCSMLHKSRRGSWRRAIRISWILDVSDADELGRVATMDLILGNALRDDGASGSDGALPQFHAWADETLRSDPRSVVKSNATEDKPERGI